MSIDPKTIESLNQSDATKIFFTDLNGKNVCLPVSGKKIESVIQNGVGFDGSSIAGYARVENSDRLLRPAPQTLRTIQFTDGSEDCFIGKIYDQSGQRSAVDPRSVLEQVLEAAENDYGFRFTIGPEHEFFLLTSDEQGGPVHSDDAGYFHAEPQDKGEVVRKQIVETLKTAGIHYEKHHHEVTPSQHEINLEPADPLEGADRTVMFNYIAQKVAAEAGYRLTFMPKPFNDYNRSAFHIHLSVCDQEGKNLFSDGDQPHGISELARHFIGGIMKYARETSLIMASTYNSYKAYVLAKEAPIVRGWGLANRSSMVRIPYSTGPASTRLELRSPDPLGNVYLQMAVLIAMGVQGVRENLDCGKPDVGSTYSKRYKSRIVDRHFLPKCLFEALMEAEKSRFLKEVLGEGLYDNYLMLKTNQWEMHRTHVTGLEHRSYLDR